MVGNTILALYIHIVYDTSLCFWGKVLMKYTSRGYVDEDEDGECMSSSTGNDDRDVMMATRCVVTAARPQPS